MSEITTVDDAVKAMIGTPKHGVDYAEQLGIELEELEVAMVNAGYDRCTLCDWWIEIPELNETDCDLLCRDCFHDVACDDDDDD